MSEDARPVSRVCWWAHVITIIVIPMLLVLAAILVIFLPAMQRQMVG